QAYTNTLERIRLSPNFGPFPTPSLKETVMFPGFDGGMEWGGGAADPDGIYYVNINEIPWLMQMVETRRADGTSVPRGEQCYMSFCASCHGLDRAGNPTGGFPSLIDVGSRKPREQLLLITRQGAGRMPAFDSLSDAQRNAILDYVLSGPSPLASRREDGNVAPASVNTTPPYAFSGFRRWADAEGYPAIKPPWGTLNAVDLNTGDIKWKVPPGEYPPLQAPALPPTGTENYGGPVVTAGGLIFIGATADETIRAFDKATGAILWQGALPFGGNDSTHHYIVT